VATLTLPGLVTGIDTAALVRQLVLAESGQLTNLRQRKTLWEDKSQAYSGLETHLETLRDAVEDLSSANELRAYEAASSDETVLTVTAQSSASEGYHEVIINRLASAEREVHAGVSTEETLVGEGTFSYTYGVGDDAVTRTLQTTAETDLTDLRDLINNDAGNPGVTASILEYDAGGSQVFHLVISGNDSGSDYVIAIDDANTTLDGTGGTVDFTSSTFTETQTAQDCQIRADGYPSGDWIERSTNTVDDVLLGISLKLRATGTAHVSVTRDTEDLHDKLEDMVEAYNAVVEFVRQETAYDEPTQQAGVMIGDYTFSYVRSQLRRTFVGTIPGFKDGQDAFTLAGQLGLTIDRDGKMELDGSELDDAISSDYLGVLSAIGAMFTGASDDDYLKFYSADQSTTAGIYDVKATFDGSGNLISAQIKLADEAESAYRDATVNGNVITGASDQAEAHLQVTAEWDGVSQTQTAEVRVRQGLGGHLYDTIEDLLDSTTGPLSIAEGRCSSTIDRIDDYIEAQEDRLDRLEERLTLKFARLERTLAILEGQQVALGMS